MKKIVNLILVLLTIYIIVYNFNYLNIHESYHPYHRYMENSTIRYVYLIAIVVDIFLLLSILTYLFNFSKQRLDKIVNWVMLCSCIVIFALVFFELYFGSTFYYGEVRDKQGLPFGVNNFGFLSTTIFSCYIFYIVFLERIVSTTRKLTYFSAFFIFVVLFQYVLFKLLEFPWRMTSS